VTKAVAGGDMMKKIEVTRVMREVGTEGRLGRQGRVTNVGGTGKDLMDNVNVMAASISISLL